MKVFRITFCVLCFSVLFMTPASAYIDPSVTTYAIQAVAGIIITAGAVAGVAWRKIRRRAKEKLGIDDNAKKEVENDVMEIQSKDDQ